MAKDLLCAVTPNADDDGATNPEADGARRRRAAAADRSFIVDCWSFWKIRGRNKWNGAKDVKASIARNYSTLRYGEEKKWRPYRRLHRRAIVAISTLKLVHMRTCFYLTHIRHHESCRAGLREQAISSISRTFVQRAKSEANRTGPLQ